VPELSTRLSAHDTVFLNWERPEQPMHVAECMVYSGHVTAADMIEMIEARIHLLPRYRQKIVAAPFGIANPTWEDDDAFDVRNHVAEMQLDGPGYRILSATCGRLYCQLIDRHRPMWHLTVLHGYAEDTTVVFLKLHHSMVDGVSSVELIEVLHDTTPDAPPPAPPRQQWQPRPIPGPLDRLRDIAADNLDLGLDAVRESIDLVRPGGITDTIDRVKKVARAGVDLAPLMLNPLSPTPFNAQIHAKRDFSWVDLPADEVKAVRTALGGTVNDLVLAILSGGLGRYMRRHGYDPEGRLLHAMCPVSVRRKSQSGAMGNLISMVVVPLHVGETNAGARMHAQHFEMAELKRRGQADAIYESISAMKWLPTPMARLMWKSWPKDYFPMHITSTNVPGPKEPLFLGKHELLHWYPFGVQWTNNALFLCTLSYRGRLVLGPVSDPDIVDDVWEFADDLYASYAELRDAAGIVARETLTPSQAADLSVPAEPGKTPAAAELPAPAKLAQS